MSGADMRWSDLPMSGTFVEMLRRLIDMSGYNLDAGPASRAIPVRDRSRRAHARRFRCVRAAAIHRQADAADYRGPRHRRSYRPACTSG